MDEVWGGIFGTLACQEGKEIPSSLIRYQKKRLQKDVRESRRAKREREKQDRQQIEAASIGASASGVSPAQSTEVPPIGVPTGTLTNTTGDDPSGEATLFSAPATASATQDPLTET